MLGRRRIRDLGPLGWLALAVAALGMVMALAVGVGVRAPVQASRPSRLILQAIGAVLLIWSMQLMVRHARNPDRRTEAAQHASILLVMLGVVCGMLSLLLGPH